MKVVRIVRRRLYDVQQMNNTVVTRESSQDMHFSIQSDRINLLIKRRCDSLDGNMLGKVGCCRRCRATGIQILRLSNFAVTAASQHANHFISISDSPFREIVN